MQEAKATLPSGYFALSGAFVRLFAEGEHLGIDGGDNVAHVALVESFMALQISMWLPAAPWLVGSGLTS